MSWQHATKFRFYIQKYSQGTTTFPITDIEESFKCRYVKMVGMGHTDVKNTYSENFAEANGLRMFTPPVADIAYDKSEISLYLRWRSDECGDVHEWANKFFDYVTAQKLEWHDTFRSNGYWQLILEKAPEIKTETLIHKPNYLIVSYKFTNFGGGPYKTSQVK